MRQTFRELNQNGNPRHKIFSVSAMLTPREKTNEFQKVRRPSIMERNRKIHLDKIKHQISEIVEQEYQAQIKLMNERRMSESLGKERQVRNHRYAPEPLRRYRKSNFQETKSIMLGSVFTPHEMNSFDLKAEPKKILLECSAPKPTQDKYTLPKMVSRKMGLPKANHHLYLWEGQLEPWKNDEFSLP